MKDESIPAKVHPVPPVEIYQVFSTELDAIERDSTAIGTDLQFALVLLPMALSLTVSLYYVSSVNNIKVFNIFAIVTVVAWFLGIIFAIRWWPKRRGLAGTLENIRARRVGAPAGQAGKEISAEQLVGLVSTEPPRPSEEGPK